MRILITGGSGQLGNELRRILGSGFAEIGPIPDLYLNAQVVSTDVNQLDITDRNAVMEFVAQGDFDLVINCAAMTNVDGCETSEAAAYRVNADAPGYLAAACEMSGAKFVQVSTDYVFPGTEHEPRLESDPTGPSSAYGCTKLAGENAVLAACRRSFVVRTAWLYGYVGKNFVKTMLRLGEDCRELTVVDDQRGNPTSANDLAYEILKIAVTQAYGIYHCTNNGTCSWADFAEAIMDGARLDCKIIRCSSEEYSRAHPTSANRPAFSSLRNKRLEDTIGDEMRLWTEALSSYLGNLEDLAG